MISHKRDIFDAAVVVVVVKTVNYTLISDVYVDETFLSLPQQKLDQNFIQFLLSIHLGVDIKWNPRLFFVEDITVTHSHVFKIITLAGVDTWYYYILSP